MNIASLLSGLSTPDLTIRAKVDQKQDSGFMKTLLENVQSSKLKDVLPNVGDEDAIDLESFFKGLSNEEKVDLFEGLDQILTNVNFEDLVDSEYLDEDHFVEWISPYLNELLTTDQTELNLDDLSDTQASMVSDLIELYVEEEHEDQLISSFSFISIANNDLSSKDTSSIEDLTPLLQEVESVLDELSMDEGQDAKELLALMKQLYTDELASPSQIDQIASQKLDSEILRDFSKIYEKFHHKMTLNKKTGYKTDTTVTGSDVMKWLKNAISNQTNTQENAPTFGQLFNQQQTHAPMEQLNVHLSGNLESVDAIADELLAKFEQAMAQSKLSFGKTGPNQMMLRLTPESLGNVLVEMTEIDGEMIVKLTASSQMAKEALEANMKELKHMFSPQNVTIEKQEPETLTVDQQSALNDSKEEQQNQNQEPTFLDQQFSDEEVEQELSFSELLEQEGV